MTKKSNQAKKSEYRNNYLPFDYYDFCITAKENENLRFRNKIRDYIHTPFDWDEDDEYYEVAVESEHANQATQTTQRQSNNNVQLEKTSYQNQLYQCQYQSRQQKNNQYQNIMPDMDPNNSNNFTHDQRICNNNNDRYMIKKNSNFNKKKSAKSTHQQKNQRKQSAKYQNGSNRPFSSQFVSEPQSPTSNNVNKNRRAWSARSAGPRSESACARRQKSTTPVPKINENIYATNLNKAIEHTLKKSISNMSVQTPHDWKLREFKKNNDSKNSNRES